MGKGGGSPDTSGLEEATKEATALQKMIYEQTREDVQPWYKMGTGAVYKLSDLLGISGGSVQSRENIYDELAPQYTTQQGGGASGFYTDAQGNLKSADYFSGLEETNGNFFDRGSNTVFRQSGDDFVVRRGEQDGQVWSPQGMQSGATDYEALNAAVDARMSEQQTTPEGYGSLLKRFSLEDFEQDPAYQFRQDEAQKALERSMAAQGVTLGGGGYGEVNPQAYRAMEEMSQGLASQEYGNAYNRYVQDNLNTFNMLTGAAGQGQGSTGILATGGQNYATNVGNLTTGLASAQFQADQASQSSGGGMFGQLLGAGAGALLGNPAFGASLGGALFG